MAAHGKTLLIADDEADVHTFVKAALEGDGYRFLDAADGETALALANLTAVAQRVGMSYSGKDMGQFYGSAPDAFIDKPVDPQTLRDTVRRLLETGPAA